MKLLTPSIGLISLAVLGTTAASAAVYTVESFASSSSAWTVGSDTYYVYDESAGTYSISVDKLNAVSYEQDPFGTDSVKITLNDVTSPQAYSISGSGTEDSPYVYTACSNNWVWALKESGAMTAEADAMEAGATIMAMDVTTIGAEYVGAPSIVFYAWAGTSNWAQQTFLNVPDVAEDASAMKSTIYLIVSDPTSYITDASNAGFMQWISAMADPATAGDTVSVYYSNLRMFDTFWESTGEIDGTWCGDVYTYSTGDGWFWSADNDSFQYSSGTDCSSAYIYDQELGWTWTSAEMYPYYYVYTSGQWAYYYTATCDDRCYFTWVSDTLMGWTDAAGLVAGTVSVEASAE